MGQVCAQEERQNSCQHQEKSHKFGMEHPKSMEQALILDAKNCNNLRADTISNVFENIKVAFKILPDGKNEPIGHQFVQCHLVFDLKIEDFRWKARFVA